MTEFGCKVTSPATDRTNVLILQGLKIVTWNHSSSTLLRKLRKLFHLLKLIAFKQLHLFFLYFLLNLAQLEGAEFDALTFLNLILMNSFDRLVLRGILFVILG